MKALPYLLALLLPLVGCDQPQGDQAGRETALEQNEQALQPSQQAAPQASTAQENPGGVDAGLVASRKLLDNVGDDSELTSFAALLRTANLTQSLSGTGPYTVLAPNDAAFKALPDSMRQQLNDPAHREQLQDLLNNHIIAGKLTTADLQDGAILKTAAGRQLKVSKRNGTVRIGNARVVESDGMSNNGVLHTLNRVLVPEPES
jgi:uncharacterized surface protein with fasciclin (FAS1) repeats